MREILLKNKQAGVVLFLERKQKRGPRLELEKLGYELSFDVSECAIFWSHRNKVAPTHFLSLFPVRVCVCVCCCFFHTWFIFSHMTLDMDTAGGKGSGARGTAPGAAAAARTAQDSLAQQSATGRWQWRRRQCRTCWCWRRSSSSSGRHDDGKYSWARGGRGYGWG